jgi:hypothetical protein
MRMFAAVYVKINTAALSFIPTFFAQRTVDLSDEVFYEDSPYKWLTKRGLGVGTTFPSPRARGLQMWPRPTALPLFATMSGSVCL